MASPFPNKWAVLFGATKYKHVGQLNYCTQDVIEVGKVLRNRLGFAPDNILEFGDGLAVEPELTPFWRKLGGFFKTSDIGSDDLLVFYFSGHGFNDKGSKDFLMPVDASLDAMDKTGIEVSELITMLKDTGCNNVVTIFDACRDLVPGAKGLIGFGGQSKSLKERPAVLSFFSCDPTDRSWEIAALKLSSFTHCLIEGINQGSVTTAGEMSDYLRRKVPALNAHYKVPIQMPWASIVPDEKRDLPIFGSAAKAEQAADRFNAMFERLVELHESKELETAYLQAAGELVILIISKVSEQSQPVALSPDEEMRLRYIEHLCTGTLKPKVFQKTWDTIDRRPRPGPEPPRLKLA